MSIRTVMRNRFAFEVLSALSGGPLSFTGVHGEAGCTGRTLSRTLKTCVAERLVEQEGKLYRLTALGAEVLVPWRKIVALDGEPGHGLPADPFELLGAPPYGRPAAIGSAFEGFSSPSAGQFVDTSEFARNEDPT